MRNLRASLAVLYSVDHHIHYYDLRRPREPLMIFKGHRKAVSYVKFMNREELVSAYVCIHIGSAE